MAGIVIVIDINTITRILIIIIIIMITSTTNITCTTTRHYPSHFSLPHPAVAIATTIAATAERPSEEPPGSTMSARGPGGVRLVDLFGRFGCERPLHTGGLPAMWP